MVRRLGAALVLGCALMSGPVSAQRPAAGAWVDVEGGRLWYETCGSGPRALVLIHDGILHSAGFDPVWAELCAQGRVVRYDRRGYGRSPAAAQPYSAVEDLAAVMRAAGISKAAVLGASFGGGLAVDFAVSRPEAVERLVLVGPMISGLPVSEHFKRRGLAVQAALQRGGISEAVKDRWFIAAGNEAARARAASLLEASPQNLAHPDPQRPAPPAAARLSQLRAPTLIVVGEDDIADVQAWAGAAEAAIPGAKRVIVGEAAHVAYFEQPEAFLASVLPFLLAPSSE